MSYLEKYYSSIEKKTEKVEESVKKLYQEALNAPVSKAKVKSVKKEIAYPPVGEEFNLKYIVENKPPKKIVIEYLKKRVDELMSDSDDD
jgi:hypothetical protein